MRILGALRLTNGRATPLYEFTDTSAQAGCDTRSISKRSIASLNSDFSFSETGYYIKAKEPCMPNYFTHSSKENCWIQFTEIVPSALAFHHRPPLGAGFGNEKNGI